jgi:hypothetical protein
VLSQKSQEGECCSYTNISASEAHSHARSVQVEGGVDILQSHRVVGESLL